MRVYRGFPVASDDHVALTIGNFDGVHRAHQAMLARVTEAASDLRLAPAVLTFDPHPREFFARDRAPARLSTLRAKLEHFSAAGVARVYVMRFNAALAALTAHEFIERVLRLTLRVRWILVGDDFRFGNDRRGDLALLRESARDFSVEAMPTLLVNGERASSSAVRAALGAGDLERAAALLGRPFSIAGHVAHGEKLGTGLGFPTANIALRHKPALSGVFAVRVRGLGPSPRGGVASLGVRPTVKAGARPLLEVFLFDFNESIYGKRVEVEFLHKLRDEERYPGLDALKQQMRIDAAQARQYLATHP
ncbi:MAG: bifunctional riboflavin kinase/FAD synthetase [Betaproteobacteria bacterium]